MTRYLVTTANDLGWPGEADEAIVLWRSCLRGRPRSEGTGSSWRLAAPFYPPVATRLELAADSRRIYDEMLPGLTKGLNAYHGMTYSGRQWEIMAGPFLIRYIRLIMNRFLKLRHSLQQDAIERSLLVDLEFDARPRDTLHLINLSDGDAWNNLVCSWILRDSFPSVVTASRGVSAAARPRPPGPPPSGSGTSRWVDVLRRVLPSKSAAGGLAIHDFHGSRHLKLRFYLRNGQLPVPAVLSRRLFPARTPGRTSPDRNRLEFGTLISDKRHGYHDAIERYLPQLLPESLLESFAQYQEEVRRSRLPTRPGVIVTSTAFDADERFKVWTADQIGRGSRYVVLQHGAVYGVNPFFEDTVEERTADAFVTWGRATGPTHVPAFCLTTPGVKIRRSRSADRLMLITMIQRRKKFIWDTEPEFDAYMKSQYRFIDSLDSSVRDKLTIRLHPGHVRGLGQEKALFEDRYPHATIETGEQRFWRSLRHCRVAVFTYDSTGLLELLNLNFPAVAFWNPDGFDQVRRHALSDYSMLKDAGILFEAPTDLAAFLSANWERIGGWWKSSSVQAARKTFCARYAAAPTGGARRLRQIILDAGRGQ